jgi:PAS domain S-box-containing protein
MSSSETSKRPASQYPAATPADPARAFADAARSRDSLVVELAEAEERNRLLSRAVRAVIYDWNVVDGSVWRSDELKRLLGYEVAEETMTTAAWWHSLLHPDDMAHTLAALEGAIAGTTERFELEYRIRHRDGHFIWVHETGLFVRNAEGRAVRCVGSVTDITESKLAEREIFETQERLRIAQMAGNVGVWDWDARKDKTYWSESMWSIYQIEPEPDGPSDALWRSLIHQDDSSRVARQIMELLASPGRTEYTDQFRIIRRDGSVRWIETSARVFRDQEGKAIRMAGVNIDITERKQAEAILDRYRIMSEQTDDIIWFTDPSGNFVDVNRAACETYGYSREEFLQMNLRDVRHASVRSAIKRDLEAANSGGAKFETIHVRKDGSSFPVEVNASGADFGGERLILAIVRDITERKAAQQAVQQSEERLRLMIESVRDFAIITTDITGKVTGWNPGAELTFGYTSGEILGRSSDILFTPEDREAGIPQKEIATALATGRAEDERWHLRKDGSRFFASGVMTMLVDNGPIGFVKLARDQTERMRAEAILKQQEILRRLVKSQEDERQRISRDLHDHLGQQMTALRLKLQALRQAEGLSADLQGQVDEVQEQAKRIDADVGFLAFELRPSVLDDLGLPAALENFLREWSANFNIAAEFHVAKLGKRRLLPDIEINVYRIAQEALNNITKHARASSVNMILEQQRSDLVLIIEDDGVGFDWEELVKNVTRSGQGLGIVGMRERAAFVDGQLEIESTPGAGTTLFIRIPARFVE